MPTTLRCLLGVDLFGPVAEPLEALMSSHRLNRCLWCPDIGELGDGYPFSSTPSPYCEMMAEPYPAELEPLECGVKQLTLGAGHQEAMICAHAEPAQFPPVMICHKASRSVSVQIPSEVDRQPALEGHGALRQRKLSLQISCPNSRSRPVYPPTVDGAAPSSANDIFSHMGEDEWQCFIHILTEHIDAALVEGRWKLQDGIRGRGPQTSAFGMSCPRF